MQEKIEALQTFADQLIQSEHYAGQDIEAKKREVLQRWAKLKEALIEKRAQLGESQTLQQFSRCSTPDGFLHGSGLGTFWHRSLDQVLSMRIRVRIQGFDDPKIEKKKIQLG